MSHRPASLSDVAKAAGVSLATASRAMNSAYGVAPATRDRVLAVAASLDYVASPDARTLASGGSSRRVALIVPHVDRWFFGAMVDGIERVTSRADVDLLLYHVDDEDHRRGFFERLPARRKVEAMVIVAFPVDERESRRLELMGVEIIAAGGQSAHYPHVCIDDYAATRQAVDHLTSLGHRRIAMLSSHDPVVPDWPSVPGRHRGYHDALRAVGVEPQANWVSEVDWGEESAARAMSELLDSDAAPTALFAHSDELAMAAMGAILERGLRIPEDISLIGIDDHPLSSPLGLSTVRQPVRLQGEIAGRMVLQSLGLEGKEISPRAVIVPTELIPRRSTAAAR